MSPVRAAIIGLFVGGAISTITVLALTPRELVATNPEPLTCEQRVDRITNEYVAIQAECFPVATSTQG